MPDELYPDRFNGVVLAAAIRITRDRVGAPRWSEMAARLNVGRTTLWRHLRGVPIGSGALHGWLTRLVTM